MALILVTAHHDTDAAETPYPHISSWYCRALSDVGAVPVLASSAAPESLAAQTDALLLTGGGDVSPALYPYHVPKKRITGADYGRDVCEIALFHAFFAAGKPIFGVCRGMQLINILLNGTLWEDLPLEPGTQIHGDGKTHGVGIGPDSWLGALFGERAEVNSCHHQACRMLGEGLTENAHSEDGICEAFCHRSRPVWGVQWHPERMAPPPAGKGTDMRPLFDFWNRMAEERAE